MENRNKHNTTKHCKRVKLKQSKDAYVFWGLLFIMRNFDIYENNIKNWLMYTQTKIDINYGSTQALDTHRSVISRPRPRPRNNYIMFIVTGTDNQKEDAKCWLSSLSHSWRVGKWPPRFHSQEHWGNAAGEKISAAKDEVCCTKSQGIISVKNLWLLGREAAPSWSVEFKEWKKDKEKEVRTTFYFCHEVTGNLQWPTRVFKTKDGLPLWASV